METKKNNPRYFKESLFNIPNMLEIPLPKRTNKNNTIPNKNDPIKNNFFPIFKRTRGDLNPRFLP